MMRHNIGHSNVYVVGQKVNDSDFGHFYFHDGTKMKMPSEIEPPLHTQSLTIAIVFELIQYTNGYFQGMADITVYYTVADIHEY